jgi:hypothetical protein
MTYDQARASKCSSCPVQDDFSNYWTPKLYYQYQNGSFQSVPTVGDSMSDQNGGMTVYYRKSITCAPVLRLPCANFVVQRGPAADSDTLKAFPEGFRMLAGDSSKRNYTGDFPANAISFSCLGSNEAETNGLPNYNCPSGLRAQVFFPSCWDGQNLDSDDHMSHMSYPASGSYNNGPCPSSHPVQLISLFFEVLYDTNQFSNMWYGNSQPFVFANGDSTGYGFHGDFVSMASPHLKAALTGPYRSMAGMCLFYKRLSTNALILQLKVSSTRVLQFQRIPVPSKPVVDYHLRSMNRWLGCSQLFQDAIPCPPALGQLQRQFALDGPLLK